MKKLGLLFLLMAPAVLADATPDGAAIFKSNCAMCHGADGKGQTPAGKSLKIRDLGSPDVQKQSDAELAKIVADGKGTMPAYKAKLGADAIQAVVAHIRTLKR
ncbi:MAG TPA: c-type cytochrome [Thermoanaerobaculia bacterium]|nr:c-type cytochrome [Thermoanaerobaculia bacterium]